MNTNKSLSIDRIRTHCASNDSRTIDNDPLLSHWDSHLPDCFG